MAKASRVLVEHLDHAEAGLDVAAVWAAVEEVVSREAVIGALAEVEQLVPQDDGAADIAMRAELAGRYNMLRPVLVLLSESNALGAATGGRKMLAAGAVAARAGTAQGDTTTVAARGDRQEPGAAGVAASGPREPALACGALDRDVSYIVCVLEQLVDGTPRPKRIGTARLDHGPLSRRCQGYREIGGQQWVGGPAATNRAARTADPAGRRTGRRSPDLIRTDLAEVTPEVLAGPRPVGRGRSRQ